MIEIAAIATGVGLLLANDGKKEEKSEVNTLPEDSDPRNGEMYFGQGVDNGIYDPFYDYSNDAVYSTPYSLQAIEMVSEALSRAYRARIIAPFLTKKDVPFSDNYVHTGFRAQKLDIDGWERGIPALPFLKGSYSVLDMVIEVFNPFDFEVPLQKMRIGNMSVGGKRIYPIPGIKNSSSHLNAGGKSFWWRNLSLCPEGLSHYWANYLLRCEHSKKSLYELKDDNKEERLYRASDVIFSPTDFEIDLVSNSYGLMTNMANYSYYCRKGVISYEKVDEFVRNRKYDANETYLKKQDNMQNANVGNARAILSAFGKDLDGNECGDTFKPLNVSGGVKPITQDFPRKLTIPARSSVLLRIELPVAEIQDRQHYCGLGYVYDGKGKGNGWGEMSNMGAWINWIGEDEMENMEQNINACMKTASHLTKDDLNQLKKLYGLQVAEREGGFLFIEMNKVGNIKESDFRMTCSFYSDARQSVIQNHLSQNQARIENTRVFDLGAYRGGRPNSADYEWEKTYWGNYPYYDSMSEADRDMGGDGNMTVDFFWTFNV